MALSESSPILNYKINLGESSLIDYINKSVYEEIKQEQETNEILNHLRRKYLPNSVRDNSFNKSMNMTYFQKNNSNKLFPIFADRSSYLNNNIFSKTAHDSFNKYNLMNYQENIIKERIQPFSLIKQKESFNLGESIKLNKEKIKNEKLENFKKNEDDYLKEENENLKYINKSYKIIISYLIEYINDISNHFIGQNTLEMNHINNFLKSNNFKVNNDSLNNLNGKLKIMKNNIINFNSVKKSQTVPLKKIDKNILNKDKEQIIKENNKEKYEYKPIIFERNNQNLEKNSKDRDGKIKRARTWHERLPKTYWNLNKKIKFREIIKYKV